MSNTAQSSHHEDLLDQACAWVVRLRAENVADSDLEQFADWLGLSQQHRQTFEQIADMWDDLAIADKLPLQQPAPVATPSGRQPLWRNSWLGWRSAGIFAAAATVVVALMVYLTPYLSSSQQLHHYQTGIGESLTVTLADGSQVELNTNSSLKVHYQDDQRWLQLFGTVKPTFR